MNNRAVKAYPAVLWGLIFLWFSNWAEAQGTLVFNGGFDTSAVGWTLANGAFYSGPGNPGGAVQLDGSPSTITDPTASQTIRGLTPGFAYVVSGDYQRTKDRLSSTTDFSFGVAIDGAFLFEAASSTNIDLTWYNFSFPYTASSPSVVLSLGSQINGTGVSYAIDNIAMHVVPEPSSLWLLVVGGIVSAMSFRRHRQRLS